MVGKLEKLILLLVTDDLVNDNDVHLNQMEGVFHCFGTE